MQLPGRLEVATKLKAEKEELEALKKGPVAVDADEESRRRLEQIKQRGGGGRAAAVEGGGGGGGGQPGKRVREEAEAEAAAAEPRSTAAGEDAGEEGGEATAGGADPFAGMSARQRKLIELRSKLQQCRKANEHAVIAERKRMQVGGGGFGASGWLGGRG
jgi:hypothetical protein